MQPTQEDQIKQLEWNLTNHKPTDLAIEEIEELRAAAKDFGKGIIKLTPYSREQSLALTNLEQALFWANAAIARNKTEDKK